MDMARENAAAENQNAVTLNLPPFWTSQPRVWFQRAEAQFALRHVTADDTKYYYVVAALDQETAQRLLSLLEKPQLTINIRVLRSVYTKCDFSPICCRTKFHQIFDVSS